MESEDGQMVMKKRTVIDFADLRFLSVECATCGTKVTIDVARTDREIPKACSCGADFATLNHAIGSFVRAYNGARDSPNPVRFEIDLES